MANLQYIPVKDLEEKKCNTIVLHADDISQLSKEIKEAELNRIKQCYLSYGMNAHEEDNVHFAVHSNDRNQFIFRCFHD